MHENVYEVANCKYVFENSEISVARSGLMFSSMVWFFFFLPGLFFCGLVVIDVCDGRPDRCGYAP
jgi:hypothetical protein